MSTYEENRNKLKRRLGPGIWIDMNDEAHWSIPELLALVELEDTPENRAEVTKMLRATLKEASPSAQIIYREHP